MSDPRPSPSSVIQVGDGAVQIDDTGAKHNTIKSRFREEMHAEFVQLLRAERARNDEVQALLAQDIAALQARLDTIETQRSDARAVAVAHRPVPAPAEADAPAFAPMPSPAPALAEADAPAFVPTPSPAPALAEAEAPAFAPTPLPSPAFPAPEPTEADAPASAPPRPQSRRLERDERRLVDRPAEERVELLGGVEADRREHRDAPVLQLRLLEVARLLDRAALEEVGRILRARVGGCVVLRGASCVLRGARARAGLTQ